MFNIGKFYCPPPIAKKNSILTVIITFRSNDRYDLISRIKYRNIEHDQIEFLIVDDGSSESDSDRALSICKELGFNYIKIHSEEVPFSPGRARNIGAIHSKTKFIVHEDIDLCPFDNYYEELVKEIYLQDLDSNISDFISIPVCYLTEDASKKWQNLDPKERRFYINQKLLDGEKDFFSFCMPASSVLVLNRYHYLSLGGYDESFVKWGLEDLDYAYRLTRSSNKFHTARSYREFVTDIPFAKQTEYRGWRAQFRMYGEACYRKGLFLVHIYHPIDRKWRNSKDHQVNLSKFAENIKKFEEDHYFLPPLPAPEFGRSLVFGKGCFVYNRKIFPFWGEVCLKPYNYFEDNDVVDYIRHNKIDRVIFTNPYANKIRLETYKKVKEAGISFYVVERGALRDSIFVDKTGFCCESTLYREEYWNHELSDEKRSLVKEYILRERNEPSSLEKQGSLLGSALCRKKLGINPGEKVLFIALQSRSDTTTNYFAGKVGSYDNFIAVVNELRKKLKSDWQIVVKPHPLSKAKEVLDEEIIVAEDYNIKDLIEISDYVLTMNSGVGVLSVVFNKPVIHMSTAFYRSDLLNRYASNADEVIEFIRSGFTVNSEISERFLSYLINDFYCFGKMKTRMNENYTDQARMSITTDIDYYSFNIDGRLCFRDTRVSSVDYDSPLYDVFRSDITKMLKFRSEKAQSVVRASSGSDGQKRKGRLLRKFLRDPKRYCLDSKYSVLNRLGKFL